MASLKDCLGKISLSGNATFWNKADHAALLKKAEKGDEAAAVKALIDEATSQLEAIRTKAGEAIKAPPQSVDPATKAIMEDADALNKAAENELASLEAQARAVEVDNPKLAETIREKADEISKMMEDANKLESYDLKTFETAVQCILNSPE